MKALVYTAPEEVVYRDEPAPEATGAEALLGRLAAAKVVLRPD